MKKIRRNLALFLINLACKIDDKLQMYSDILDIDTFEHNASEQVIRITFDRDPLIQLEHGKDLILNQFNADIKPELNADGLKAYKMYRAGDYLLIYIKRTEYTAFEEMNYQDKQKALELISDTDLNVLKFLI